VKLNVHVDIDLDFRPTTNLYASLKPFQVVEGFASLLAVGQFNDEIVGVTMRCQMFDSNFGKLSLFVFEFVVRFHSFLFWFPQRYVNLSFVSKLFLLYFLFRGFHVNEECDEQDDFDAQQNPDSSVRHLGGHWFHDSIFL